MANALTGMMMTGYVRGFLDSRVGARVVSSSLLPRPFTHTPTPTSSQRFKTTTMRFFKLRRTSRRALPGLNALKISLKLLSKAGSAVPPLQAVAETALEIIEYAEVCLIRCRGP